MNAQKNAQETPNADTMAKVDYFRSKLSNNEMRAIFKAAESQKNNPFPGAAILKSSADWIFEQPDGRGVKFLFCSQICGEFSFTYEGKREKLTITPEDELRAEPFPIDPDTLSGIDRFQIERMSATSELYLAAWHEYAKQNVSHDMMVGAGIMLHNFGGCLAMFKVIDDATGEIGPLFPPGGPDFEKEATPGYENSPLWGAAYIGADGGRPSFGAGLLIQAAAMRCCAEGGKIDRDLLAEVTGPAVEITNGLPPHFPTDPETRGMAEKVIGEAEKSAKTYITNRNNGMKGKGYGIKGGRPRKTPRGFLPENPKQETLETTIETILETTVETTDKNHSITIAPADQNGNGNGFNFDGDNSLRRLVDQFERAAKNDEGAFFAPEHDPAIICAAIAGDCKSMRRWRQLTKEKGEGAVREEAYAMYREMRAGEMPRSRGAALNARLAKLADETR